MPRKPLIYPDWYPFANVSISGTPIHTRRVGLLTMRILRSTASLRKYFSPTHRRRDATFSCVISGFAGADPLAVNASGGSASDGSAENMGDREDGGGGVGPPTVTVPTYPERCIARRRLWSCLVEGIEVSPRRAADAFWRWEQAWERSTRDIFGGDCLCLR